jgi:hypothetical protein
LDESDPATSAAAFPKLVHTNWLKNYSKKEEQDANPKLSSSFFAYVYGVRISKRSIFYNF